MKVSHLTFQTMADATPFSFRDDGVVSALKKLASPKQFFRDLAKVEVLKAIEEGKQFVDVFVERSGVLEFISVSNIAEWALQFAKDNEFKGKTKLISAGYNAESLERLLSKDCYDTTGDSRFRLRSFFIRFEFSDLALDFIEMFSD